MAEKKKLRFVYNVKTGVAHGATKTILDYMHKKNMKDLRLMPVSWQPGDDVDLTPKFEQELPPAVVAAIATNIAKSMPNADEQVIRMAVAEATGQQVAAPKNDKVEEIDPMELQETVAAISDMEENAANYTSGGKPDAKVLAEKMGRRVSAVERDQAFELFKAQAEG